VGLKGLNAIEIKKFDTNELRTQVEDMLNTFLNMRMLSEKSHTFNKLDMIRK